MKTKNSILFLRLLENLETNSLLIIKFFGILKIIKSKKIKKKDN